ncbi:MAG: cation transporter [Bdellovibrionaceae bacterium]|nr:cation transporter [Bdellovibrionales bacterium]MCB9253400.1 cation transporter [Pseudobdellovibrionaceae bacterium]
MSTRSNSIVKVLLVCLSASTLGAALKIVYGYRTATLAFTADGIHSLFDSTSTIVGIISVILASKPPDDDHPYGHQKFETVASLILSFMLILAGYEVGTLAFERFMHPERLAQYSFWGFAILLGVMVVNLSVAFLEARKAKELSSQFLLADSYHNRSDFLVTCAVFVSLLSSKFSLPYVDGAVALLIAIYLVYMAIQLLRETIDPLVDHSVLDPEEVERVASSVKGVLHCHAIRSRGHDGHKFLDLNIHLPGDISLFQAHEITHTVEDRLKKKFPDLVDVVIHTEPHGHPPCAV